MKEIQCSRNVYIGSNIKYTEWSSSATPGSVYTVQRKKLGDHNFSRMICEENLRPMFITLN